MTNWTLNLFFSIAPSVTQKNWIKVFKNGPIKIGGRKLLKMFEVIWSASVADPDYIHLCKCWSHICSVKVIKKIPEDPFSPTNYFILFFCRSKRLKRLRPRHAVVILQNLSNVFACQPCGKNCFSRKYSKIQ